MLIACVDLRELVWLLNQRIHSLTCIGWLLFIRKLAEYIKPVFIVWNDQWLVRYRLWFLFNVFHIIVDLFKLVVLLIVLLLTRSRRFHRELEVCNQKFVGSGGLNMLVLGLLSVVDSGDVDWGLVMDDWLVDAGHWLIRLQNIRLTHL